MMSKKHLFLIALSILTIVSVSYGQRADNSLTPYAADVNSEPTIVNGTPGMRFVTKSGSESIVYLKKLGDEDAIAFSVVNRRSQDKGWLYVTRTRIAYEPENNPKQGFNVLRSGIKKITNESTRMGEHYLKIELAKADKSEFFINFSPEPSVLLEIPNGRYQKPVFELFERAVDSPEGEYIKIHNLAASVKDKKKPDYEKDIKIKSEYDRFKDITSVVLLSMKIDAPFTRPNGWLGVSAIFQVSGQQRTKPQNVIISFEKASTVASFANPPDRNLILLVDGKRLTVGATDYDFKIVSDYVITEYVYAVLPYEVFSQIASAQKVEAQLGRYEFELSPSHLEGFRTLMMWTK